MVLALVRSITGNTAAGMGLHAGWVWVMLVVHGLSQPNRAAPLGFLLSRHDGFTGWLVLGWTVVLGIRSSARFYSRREGSGRSALRLRRLGAGASPARELGQQLPVQAAEAAVAHDERVIARP